MTIEELKQKLEYHEQRMSEQMNIEKAIVMLQTVVVLTKDKEIQSLVGEVIKFLKGKQ